MISKGIYPWQQTIWSRIHQDRSHLHHACLFKGKSGIGKFDFAIHYAKSLLCDHPIANHEPCGQCQSCHWFDLDNHPDFVLIEPEVDSGKDDELGNSTTKKKTQISVDQIRALASFMGLTSHRKDGLKVVLIHPMEALNLASSNALLKMLEEPSPDVIFLMVTHQPQRLLPTIMSRCQKIDLPIPAREDALQWLKSHGVNEPETWLDYYGGSPLKAIQAIEEEGLSLDVGLLLKAGRQIDVSKVSAELLVSGMENAVIALQKWCYDLLLMAMIKRAHYHDSQKNVLSGLVASVNLSALLDYIKLLNTARKSASHPLNNDLQLSSLLYQYGKIFDK
jgi:DNA polymerase III subunit delta'